MECVEHDNGSLTPPLSPMLLDSEDFLDSFPCPITPPKEVQDFQLDNFNEENDLVVLPLFTCNSGNRKQPYHIVERVFKRPTCSTAHQANTESSVELFGYNFSMVLDDMTLDKYFLFLRQWIGKFESMSTETIVSQSQQWREDISHFVDYLKTWINIHRSNGSNTDTKYLGILEQVLQNICNTLLYVEHLGNIPWKHFSGVNSREYHQFHVTLDIYWKLLELLHAVEREALDMVTSTIEISRNWKNSDENHRPVLMQYLNIILWELIILANDIFRKTSIKEAVKTTPFSCPCIQDMWLRLICFMKYRHDKQGGESFWIHMHSIIQVLLDDTPYDEDMETDSDVYLYPSMEIGKGDNSTFCLWLLMHISDISEEVSQSNKGNSRSNYHDVEKILKKYLSKNDIPEAELRFLLQVSLKLLSSWGADINLLVILWDYFYKRMNCSFQITTSSVDVVASLSKTAGGLLENCTRLSSGNYVLSTNDTSFQMFIGLLCTSLKDSLDKGSSQEWKQMKGRVYSKFHLRRIQELRETGLHNFCTLFMSMALTGDIEDVSSKMSGFCHMVELTPQNVGKKSMAWKGLFALIIAFVQRKMDVTFLAQHLESEFSKLCSDFQQDSGHRYSMWQLISLYLDSLQEVFERSSDFSSSQNLLIGDGFGPLLCAFRSNELQTALSVLQEILAKIRSYIEHSITTEQEGITVLYRTLYSKLYPALKDLSCSVTAPVEVADCLAGLTLLAIQFNADNFLTIVKFCLGDNVCKSIMCRYLSQILCVDDVISQLKIVMPNYQILLVQSWIRCAIFVPNASTVLKSMLELDDVRSIFHLAGMEIQANPDNRSIYHFLKAIQSAYSKVQGWKERIELRDKVMMYFSDIHKQISPLLQSLQPQDMLKNAFAVVGYIVKCCAPLIFVQSKADCPLPNIINSMVVPHIMFNTEKPVSSVYLGVVKEYLHQFVMGLSKLEYRKAPYVQRRLGDIVSIYLPKFWSTASSHESSAVSSVHPLVVSLRDSFVKDPTESAVNFRQFVLELVRDKFLLGNSLQLPAHHQVALVYLKEIVKRTFKKEIIVKDGQALVYASLKVSLLSDVSSIQTLSHYLIQHYTETTVLHGSETDKESMEKTLLKFITDYKKTHLDASLKCLEKVPKACARYFQGFSKQIQHYIVEHEANRGVGTDSKIRSTFMRLMHHNSLAESTDKC